jgi:hypothetical protein
MAPGERGIPLGRNCNAISLCFGLIRWINRTLVSVIYESRRQELGGRADLQVFARQNLTTVLTTVLTTIEGKFHEVSKPYKTVSC